jgi:hypothetical protein
VYSELTKSALRMSFGAEKFRRSENLPASVEQSYFLALLLTGSHQEAEPAVMGAINSIGIDPCTEDFVIDVAKRWTIAWPGILSPDVTTPFGLEYLFELPPTLRQCYVLRVIAGLPTKMCTDILRLAAPTVEDELCIALQLLPEIATKHVVLGGGAL